MNQSAFELAGRSGIVLQTLQDNPCLQPRIQLLFSTPFYCLVQELFLLRTPIECLWWSLINIFNVSVAKGSSVPIFGYPVGYDCTIKITAIVAI